MAEARAAGEGTVAGAVVATASMTAALTLTSAANFAAPVLAPVAAASFGLAPTLVGTHTALVFLAAMLTGLIAGDLTRRLGPVRVNQLTLLVSILGLATLFTGSIVVAALGALLLGAAHGISYPAASVILAGTTPARLQSLVFSIKQTGVPLGAALSGLVLPPLAEAFGWRASLLALMAALGLLALLLAPMRATHDAARDRRQRVKLRGAFTPLRLLLASPRLRALAGMAFVNAWIQYAIAVYLVVYLTQSLSIAFVVAGSIYALAQLTGAATRVVWGLLASFLLGNTPMLSALGVATALLAMAAALLHPGLGLWMVGAVTVLLASLSVGWTGLYLAEVARSAPAERVSDTTGAGMFVAFSGVVVGPPVFGLAASVIGFAGAFFALGILGLLGVLRILPLTRADLRGRR